MTETSAFIPQNIQSAAAAYHQSAGLTPFEQGYAYGRLLREIDRERLHRPETLRALGIAFEIRNARC